MVGRNCRFLQGPETDPADIDAIRRGLADGSDHVSVELLNYRKDGRPFWNQLAISPVTDEHGELLYYFASQKDVTERRRIEQMEAMERHLLMEVDHRALNVLAMVQGIVRLTKADTIGHYSSAILGRVDALARAHRILARSGWMGADIAHLMAAEIPDHEAPRIDAIGEPSQLPPELVQPLALVLHELMVNARKHGGLARREGRITVTWTEQSGALTLEWQEHGVPDLEPAPELGFGLRTLVGVIERQLQGEVSTSWTSPGFGARIRVPISRAKQTSPA